LIVAALIGAAADRTNFAGTLRREITARFCADSDELHSLVATGVVDAIVADLDTVRHSSLWPSVRAIVDWHPTIPLVLWLSLNGDDMRSLVAIAGEIALDAVIIRELDDCSAIIAGAIRSACEGSATQSVVRGIERLAPQSVRSLLIVGARHAERPLTVHAWAARAGVSQRTLLVRMRDAGLPPVHQLIRWFRLLHVAARLDMPKATVERVVETMRFTSSATLRHLLKRVTGLSPGAQRDAGGFDYLLGLVELLSSPERGDTATDQDSPLADLGRLDQHLQSAWYESRGPDSHSSRMPRRADR